MSSGFVKLVETEHLQIVRINQQPEAIKLIKTCQKDVKNLVGWLRFNALDCKNCTQVGKLIYNQIYFPWGRLGNSFQNILLTRNIF